MIVRKIDGDRKVVYMTWGLVPSWSQDRRTGHHPINAQAETISDKPMFARLVERMRCLIPASGFYEWKNTKRGKIPYYIHRKDEALFAFAGLYDVWKGEDPPFCSCTIVTTAPNPVITPLHDRMPAILRREDESTWLAESTPDPIALTHLLSPYPAEDLESYPVSLRVNDTTQDSRALIGPLKQMHLIPVGDS